MRCLRVRGVYTHKFHNIESPESLQWSDGVESGRSMVLNFTKQLPYGVENRKLGHAFWLSMSTPRRVRLDIGDKKYLDSESMENHSLLVFCIHFHF